MPQAVQLMTCSSKILRAKPGRYKALEELRRRNPLGLLHVFLEVQMPKGTHSETTNRRMDLGPKGWLESLGARESRWRHVEIIEK